MTNELCYSIFDPSGNITLLVETPVPERDQIALAKELQNLHPEVEQVGFVQWDPSGDTPLFLRMAGGEFCGNASMSAAAFFCIRNPERCDEACDIWIRVSGAKERIPVSLRRTGAESFCAELEMPAPKTIRSLHVLTENGKERIPCVELEGIAHLIIRENNAAFSWKQDRTEAERRIRAICEEYGFPGLGFLFLEGDGPTCAMTPLVYIPGSDTIYWENSCASGTAAVGMAIASESGAQAALTLKQPGGTLSVSCNANAEHCILSGNTKRTGSCQRPYSM